MQKFKALISLLLAIVLLIPSFALTSCYSDPSTHDSLPHILSGEKVDLSESILKIETNYDLANEKNGYVNHISLDANINGYRELSYFNSSVSLVWNYDVLLDGSEGYTKDSYTVTLNLDAEGNANYKETIILENCRSMKNIKCMLIFNGYAVKK